MNQCCEKCGRIEQTQLVQDMRTGFSVGGAVFSKCINPSCPCHKSVPGGGAAGGATALSVPFPAPAKEGKAKLPTYEDMPQQQEGWGEQFYLHIAKARKDTLKEVVTLVEGKIEKNPASSANGDEWSSYTAVRNSTLSDIRSAVTTLLEQETNK